MSGADAAAPTATAPADRNRRLPILAASCSPLMASPFLDG
jgi:hypothetical protein